MTANREDFETGKWIRIIALIALILLVSCGAIAPMATRVFATFPISVTPSTMTIVEPGTDPAVYVHYDVEAEFACDISCPVHFSADFAQQSAYNVVASWPDNDIQPGVPTKLILSILTNQYTSTTVTYQITISATAQVGQGMTDSGTATATLIIQPLTTTAAGSGTDWAVTSVSLSPSAPNVGDQVTFSTVITAVSSPGPFPQDVEVGCMLDSAAVGSGTLSYPGPVGVPMPVSSQTPWTATPGTHTLTCAVATIPAGLDPNKGNNLMSTTFTVGQAPQQQFDFSISASPSTQTINPGGSTGYAVSVNLLSGSPQGIALTLSGAPDGVSASFTQPSGTPPFTSTLNVAAAASAAPGSYTITITGTAGPGVTRTATVTLAISQAADFQVNVSPSFQTVLQGGTVSYSVNVVGLNGFNSQVSLSVSGLPSGASGVFSVPSATSNFDSTLTVTLPMDVSTGTFTLTVTGNGGGISRTASTVLAVNGAAQTISSNTQTISPSGSDIMGIIQQNLLSVALGVIVLILVAVLALTRRQPRGPTPAAKPPAEVVYCRKCGTRNPFNDEFCGNCGERLR